MAPKMNVFMLYYARPRDDGEFAFKLCGVYSSEEEIRRAVRRFRERPDFRHTGSMFYRDRFTVDADSWTGVIIPGVEFDRDLPDAMRPATRARPEPVGH